VRPSLSSSAARSTSSNVAPLIENLATSLPSSLRSTIIPGSLTQSMRWYGPMRIGSSLMPHPMLWRLTRSPFMPSFAYPLDPYEHCRDTKAMQSAYQMVLFSVILESSEALRAAISISNTTSSAMVSKQSTSLVWPCLRACSNALTNQAKAAVPSSALLLSSNQTPSARTAFTLN
jgi:hypothetical protein